MGNTSKSRDLQNKRLVSDFRTSKEYRIDGDGRVKNENSGGSMGAKTVPVLNASGRVLQSGLYCRQSSVGGMALCTCNALVCIHVACAANDVG